MSGRLPPCVSGCEPREPCHLRGLRPEREWVGALNKVADRFEKGHGLQVDRKRAAWKALPPSRQSCPRLVAMSFGSRAVVQLLPHVAALVRI
jgi:hypothetical protein